MVPRRGFLVAPLHRAIPLSKVDDIALFAISEDLDLNVAHIGQVALEIDGAISRKRIGTLGLARQRKPRPVVRGSRSLACLFAATSWPDALLIRTAFPKPTHEVATPVRGFVEFCYRRSPGPLARRRLAPPSAELSRPLVPQQLDLSNRRSHERELPCSSHSFSEPCVLGQKPITWMNGVGAGDLARRDDAPEC